MNEDFFERMNFLNKMKATGRRLTIGFAGVADLRSFIGQEFISGIIKAAEDYDINFINMARAIKYSVFDDVDFMATYRHNLKFMKKPLVDGMVTWASSFSLFAEKEAVIKMISELKPLPMVDIGSIDIPGVPSIRVDNSISMKQLFDHLVNVHGYKKFLFVGVDDKGPHKRRYEFFKRELQERKLPEFENQCFFMKNMSVSQMNDIFSEILKKFNLSDRKEVDVIITSSDTIAAQFTEVMCQNGIFVPRDVAVTGYNNWHDGISSICPVTTIDLEVFKRGYVAVELLLDRIISVEKNELASEVSISKNMLIPTRLIPRESCGCFENCVLESYLDGEEDRIPLSLDSGEDFRNHLEIELKKIFFNIKDDDLNKLILSIFSDIYSKKNPSETVKWFQVYLQECRKRKDLDGEKLQTVVSALRKSIIPALKSVPDCILSVENVFHQMRALIAMFLKYETISTRENPYRLNTISQLAVNLDSSSSKKEFFDEFDSWVNELEISSVIIALGEKSSYSFPEVKIEHLYPQKISIDEEKKIADPCQFPVSFYMGPERFSISLEVLNHSGVYFGYAFFKMKSLNIAIYDMARMLLSNGLYSVYGKLGLNAEYSYEVRKEQIEELAKIKSDSSKRPRLTGEKITEYLVDHIGDVTNLQEMAEHFMVSKSYLIKKSRELTGTTIQQFHEKLKIEQAKNMLLLGTFTIEEISNRLGFANKNYFSNVFKKNTGLSPRNWLKQK